MTQKINPKLHIVYRPGKPKYSLAFLVDNKDEGLSVDTGYMRQTEEKALKQKTNKGKLFNMACFGVSILVLVISLLIQGSKFGVNNLTTLSFNTKYLVLTFVVFTGIMLCDSVRTYFLLLRSTGRHRPIDSFKSSAICRYYDCITPFAFGGQPFQIYYLSTRGIKGGVASSVPLAKYIYSQLTFCITSIVLLVVGIARGMFGTANTQTIITFSIITLVVCILFLSAIFFISLSKKVTPKVVWWGIDLCAKLRLVKKKEVAFTHSMRTILEYQRSFNFYIKSIWVSITNFILSFAMIFLKGLIPYLIYLTLVPNPTVGYFEILILYNVCELVTMFIPLPGGSGVAELSFTALFSAMFPVTYIFWAMILFRVFTYYIYIFQGLIVSLYDIAIGNKKNERKSLERMIK